MSEETKPTDEVLMQENRNLQIVQKALEGALRQVFGEGVTADRFIDKSRLPLICKNVEGLHENYLDMKESTEKSFQDIKDTTEKNFNAVKDVAEKNFMELKDMIAKKDDDHESRLRTLEAFMNTLIGKIAMVAIMSSVTVSLIFIGIQYFLSRH